MAGATDNLERLIDLLGKIARADRCSWNGIAQQVRANPRILTEAGTSASVIASSGRNLILQMDLAIPENETEFRGLAQALAVILGNELSAHGGPDRAHWAKDTA